LGESEETVSLLRALHELGLEAEQLAFLRSRDCDEAQGRFLYPVLPPDAFAALLRRWSTAAKGAEGHGV